MAGVMCGYCDSTQCERPNDPEFHVARRSERHPPGQPAPDDAKVNTCSCGGAKARTRGVCNVCQDNLNDAAVDAINEVVERFPMGVHHRRLACAAITKGIEIGREQALVGFASGEFRKKCLQEGREQERQVLQEKPPKCGICGSFHIIGLPPDPRDDPADLGVDGEQERTSHFPPDAAADAAITIASVSTRAWIVKHRLSLWKGRRVFDVESELNAMNPAGYDALIAEADAMIEIGREQERRESLERAGHWHRAEDCRDNYAQGKHDARLEAWRKAMPFMVCRCDGPFPLLDGHEPGCPRGYCEASIKAEEESGE